MKAVQLFGNKDIRIVDVDEPIPEANEALVSVEWCGICGSDLKEYQDGPLVVSYKLVPEDQWKPMTLGHEIVGRIKWAPEGSSLKPGDPVVVNPASFDGDCERCEKYGASACKIMGSKGLSGGFGGTPGGLAEVVAVEVQKCYKLPESLPLDLAALIEPICVAWHGAKAPGFDTYAGKTALVVGCGPVGLYLTFALKNQGVKTVIVTEPTEQRRQQAQGIADIVLDPLVDDVVKECLERTGGNGVDVTFDAAGARPGLETALKALKYRGKHVNIAMWSTREVSFP
jgi:threonine dehydrogenase-like Zn-dependent dehydrogenase